MIPSTTGRGYDRDLHLCRLETEHDEHLCEAVHHGERRADLDDLGLAEVRSDHLTLRRCGRSALVQVCIGEDERRLVPIGETAVCPRIANLLDEILGKPLLPRDREAELLSKTAVGDRGVAQSRNLLRRLLDDAVAPQVTVERSVGRRGEVLRDGINRRAAGIAQAR